MEDTVPVFLLRSGIFLSKRQQQLLQEVFMTDEEQKPDLSGENPGKQEGEGAVPEEQDVDTSGTGSGEGDADSEATGAGPSGGAPETTSPGGAGGDSSATGAGPS